MGYQGVYRSLAGGRTAANTLGVSEPTHRLCGGFTLIELMIVVAIISTLAAIAVPLYGAFVDKTKVARAIIDIKQIATEIQAYSADTMTLPVSLNDVGYGSLLDPWGRPYQYLNIETVKGKGKVRKDKNLVPINSDYDLYSMGKDGQSQTPLTAKASRDDIVRANNGGYVGLASAY
jgi:general secretion pathway protein G